MKHALISISLILSFRVSATPCGILTLDVLHDFKTGEWNSYPSQENMLFLSEAVGKEAAKLGAQELPVRIAAAEMIANASEHGNLFDPQKRVWVKLSIDESKHRVVLEIRDESGIFFDPNDKTNKSNETRMHKGDDPAVVDQKREQAKKRPGGKGVLLTQELATSAKYSKWIEDGQLKGTWVTLTWDRP